MGMQVQISVAVISQLLYSNVRVALYMDELPCNLNHTSLPHFCIYTVC